MAGKKPFFLSGANAKIVINNKTVAFATDISFSIAVKHATPRVLGRFEVEAVQPLAYDVEGSLTIIRYARGLKDHIGEPPEAVNQAGNGVGSFDSNQGQIARALGLPSNGQFDGGAADNFVPGRMFQSKMFDIEIRQKIPPKSNFTASDAAARLRRLSGLDFINDILVPDGLNDSDNDTIVFRLRDCRFTALDLKLNKRGLPMQTMQFKARYADDDTYVAAKSGVGQELV